MTVRKKKEPIDPMDVQIIENNLILKQVAEKIKEISVKQDVNHLVAVALRDHKTIERVDTMWQGFGNLKFLMWVVASVLGLVPITAAILGFTHVMWKWPS